MRRFVLITTAALLSAPPLRAQAASVNHLQWLGGCWERLSGATRSIEKWNPAVNGVMTGESHTYVNGSERETEKLRLFARGDSVVYEATPSGQRLTEFATASTEAPEITFSNSNHDFPQRIVYRRVGSDSMVARIEGDRAGRRRPVSFQFTRIPCPATGRNLG